MEIRRWIILSSKVQIGKTSMQVTKLGYGANSVGGHNLFPNLKDETGKEVVNAALDAGVDFLDTAFIYGLGKSEELIGEVLKERGNRDKVVIASKAAHKPVDGKIVLDNSRQFLRDSVEESLKKLQTDHIDLFYVHYPDGVTPLAEVAGTLKELKDEGKIGAVGASNLNAEQLKEFNKDGYLEVFQGEYSLLKREAENTFLPYCVENGISFVPYFPLASGLLTGKFSKDAKFDDIRAKDPLFQGQAFLQNLEKVEQLKALAKEKGFDATHLALAWLLKQPAVDVIIPGAKTVAQLQNNLRTLDVNLTDDETAKISRIFS
ncbi:aldo/keto reductase [Niallia circulans]|uniref:Aldo/keto reductase n=2 Tax=Niallia circulans TaxID=1397 RepID=A0A553SGZ8_NIACI|nr:aldo/keto reductase [Niallia circulans]